MMYANCKQYRKANNLSSDRMQSVQYSVLERFSAHAYNKKVTNVNFKSAFKDTLADWHVRAVVGPFVAGMSVAPSINRREREHPWPILEIEGRS